jgi:hypothetical protein
LGKRKKDIQKRNSVAEQDLQSYSSDASGNLQAALASLQNAPTLA